jgi:hypothetical protein
MSSTLNFDSITPAVKVGPVRAYINLPAFSQAGVTWKGGSEIVMQYNYSASKAFVLNNRPVMPTGANYLLCIKYRVGYTVYRYKLWQNIGEVLPEVPLYTGQVIKANFVLEIWNIETSTVVSSEDGLDIILSLRRINSDFTSLADYSEDTGDEQTFAELKIFTGYPDLPTENLIANYSPDSTGLILVGDPVTQWQDTVGDYHLTPIGSGPPIASTSFGGADPSTVPNFDAVNKGLVNNDAPFAIRDLYIFAYVPTATTGTYLFRGVSGLFNIQINATTQTITVVCGASNTTLNYPASLELFTVHIYKLASDDTLYIEVLNNVGIIAATTIAGSDDPSVVGFAVGDTSNAAGLVCQVAEIIIYDDYNTLEQQTLIKQNLFGRYNSGGIVLPTTITDDQAWLDNS